MNLFSRLVKPSVWITLSCVLFAVLLDGLFNLCGKTIDERRLDQIEISHIETQCGGLVSILDGATQGEDISGFDSLRAAADVSVQSFETGGDRDDVQTMRRAYFQFADRAGLEIAAARAGDLARARELDAQSTIPAFSVLQALTSELDQRCRREAESAIARIRILTGVTLLLSALVVSLLYVRHQQKVSAVHIVEAARMTAETSERRFRTLIRNTGSVIAVVDKIGRFMMVSEVSERLWGFKPSQLVGESVYRHVQADDVLRLIQAIAMSLDGVDSDTTEVRILNINGSYKTFRVNVTDLTADADVQGLLLTFHDVTERKRLQGELTRHASHDRLTGLPNRTQFMERLSTCLIEHEAKCSCAVLFIDLDNFKVINDSLGHAAGDEMLLRVAERLKGACLPFDTIARLGGDEFTVLLQDAGSPDEAVATAERLIRSLSAPITVAGRAVFVTCSIGIALRTGPTEDAFEVVRDADTAMYRAKSQGKNSFAIFDPTMNEFAVERLELEAELRRALEDYQFTLNYQPIVDMASGEIFEAEALIRWQHPTRGLIPPMKFIPIAEETDLICPIGRWVLREALAQLKAWDKKFPQAKPLGMCLNVSGRQLQQPGFFQLICDTLNEFQVDPKRIELEITETALLKDLDAMCAVCEQLREAGVRIAIDDFGTGYSSIAYLSRLPVDTLKIDRSFVIALGRDARTSGVIQAMVGMAKALGLRTTCEGIETQAQLDALRALACDLGQGYLFAKPLSSFDMGQLLAEQQLRYLGTPWPNGLRSWR